MVLFRPHQRPVCCWSGVGFLGWRFWPRVQQYPQIHGWEELADKSRKSDGTGISKSLWISQQVGVRIFTDAKCEILPPQKLAQPLVEQPAKRFGHGTYGILLTCRRRSHTRCHRPRFASELKSRFWIMTIHFRRNVWQLRHQHIARGRLAHTVCAQNTYILKRSGQKANTKHNQVMAKDRDKAADWPPDQTAHG